MHRHRTRRRLVAVGLTAAAAALVIAATASAHAKVSPPVVLSKTGQVFSLAVPTEEEGSTTTKVELTPPIGLLDRLVRPLAGLAPRRSSRPAPARTPSSRR